MANPKVYTRWVQQQFDCKWLGKFSNFCLAFKMKRMITTTLFGRELLIKEAIEESATIQENNIACLLEFATTLALPQNTNPPNQLASPRFNWSCTIFFFWWTLPCWCNLSVIFHSISIVHVLYRDDSKEVVGFGEEPKACNRYSHEMVLLSRCYIQSCQNSKCYCPLKCQSSNSVKCSLQCMWRNWIMLSLSFHVVPVQS